jgi:hypothetical protein
VNELIELSRTWVRENYGMSTEHLLKAEAWLESLPMSGGMNNETSDAAVVSQPRKVACCALPTSPLLTKSKICVGMTMGTKAAYWAFRQNHKMFNVTS